MSTIKLEQATSHLPEVIASLQPGEQIVIVDRGKPLATLTRAAEGPWPCRAGSAKESKHWMAPDFDAPLDDFREYSQ
jgi:antitoxin (DNA-binding transcriptional repressor) of toxin-antitoxin stability system